MEKLCIYISSCDKYSDLWNHFIFFFKKNWPDCPYTIFLGTNSKPHSSPVFTQVFSNKFSNWSEETIEIVKQLPYDYILYMQDDYFLTQKVSSEKIGSLFTKMLHLNAVYLRLYPSPGPDVQIKNESEIGLISENAEYRTSLQSAIWKKETFLSLLNKKETSWEFESNSPVRSKGHTFLSVNKIAIYPITYYDMTAVYKGKWMRKAVKMCKEQGLTIDTDHRKIETKWEEIYRNLYFASPKFVQHIHDFIKSRFF